MNENFKEELERLAEEHMLDMVDDDLEDIQNKDDLINMIEDLAENYGIEIKENLDNFDLDSLLQKLYKIKQQNYINKECDDMDEDEQQGYNDISEYNSN